MKRGAGETTSTVDSMTEPLDLGPLPLTVARDLISEWELRWWEGLRTSERTDPDQREHGDVTVPSDAVRLMTQWIGRNFAPPVVEFFAAHISGTRVALDKLVAEQYQQLAERVEVLEGMVRDSLDGVRAEREVEQRIDSLEQRASAIIARLDEAC